jgi:hypothetical protein
MLKYYESSSLLFEFLAIPKNSKKHWNDNSSWTMAKFMHLRGYAQASKVIMGVVYYVVLNCDEISIVDK